MYIRESQTFEPPKARHKFPTRLQDGCNIVRIMVYTSCWGCEAELTSSSPCTRTTRENRMKTTQVPVWHALRLVTSVSNLFTYVPNPPFVNVIMSDLHMQDDEWSTSTPSSPPTSPQTHPRRKEEKIHARSIPSYLHPPWPCHISSILANLVQYPFKHSHTHQKQAIGDVGVVLNCILYIDMYAHHQGHCSRPVVSVPPSRKHERC
jgi:hypothetical protein